ncbi:unnamed protein product [Cuscuta campestris]|uniref:Protein kinase domain-containing protein n=1 Tax=Cuscuta campestris TaxID=132261 RepID=A0A484NHJ3_9ASTE|nr:unnamed protein product [Cuscuta campestris]
MAAALECWSSRASTDEDMAEQVLMRAGDRSEGALRNAASSSFDVCGGGAGGLKESSAMQKRFQKLGRNVSEAIASLKNSFNIDSVRESPAPPPSPHPAGRTEGCRKQFWAGVVRSLTQLYPGSQLPERLVSNIRKHYDSLPLSYAQAGFEMKDVFLHIKLLEQASMEDQPAIMIQEASEEDEEVHGSGVYKLTFACSSSISWPAMSGALDSASISCRKTQIFEKKGFTLGVVLLLVQQIDQERIFRTRIENALKSALKKPKNKKLPFRLCGCQEQNTPGREFGEVEDEDCGQPTYRTARDDTSPEAPLHSFSFIVSVNEWQTVQSSGNEIEKWLLSPDMLEFTDQLGPCTFKGVYKGKRVGIEKLKGCDKGNAYEFELRRDLLELMTCQHRSILHFYGVCIDDDHGLCVVTKLMEGGSVHDYLFKNKKIQTKEIMKIACDVAEGLQFMNDHGVSYRDLNTQKILLDKYGNACLGDMGIVAACNGGGEAMEYETDGYRWLAPEIIAGDPENVAETWMSNAYSFGMILWELVTGEEAYSSYSPVQAAVGIAACGLRPEIPKDCPQTLRSLMTKCWNSCPSKRPPFSHIVSTLTPSQQQ